VPWRFLDAGQLSLPSVSSLPAPKNQHKTGLGRLDVALDLAATNQWTVVDMNREWKVDISLPKTVSGGSVTQFDKHWHPKNEGI
jgi:hypothetical protein